MGLALSLTRTSLRLVRAARDGLIVVIPPLIGAWLADGSGDAITDEFGNLLIIET